jgi:hypothetical protein
LKITYRRGPPAACVLHNICLEIDGNIDEYINEGWETPMDNDDDYTPFTVYGQEENSPEAEGFQNSIFEQLLFLQRRV